MNKECQNEMCKHWRSRIKNSSCIFNNSSQGHLIKMDAKKRLLLSSEFLEDIKLEDANDFNEQFDKLIKKIPLESEGKWMIYQLAGKNILGIKLIN